MASPLDIIRESINNSPRTRWGGLVTFGYEMAETFYPLSFRRLRGQRIHPPPKIATSSVMKYFGQRVFSAKASNFVSSWINIPFGVDRLYINAASSEYPFGGTIVFEWRPLSATNAESFKLPANCRDVQNGSSGVDEDFAGSFNAIESEKWFEFIVPSGFADVQFRISITNYSSGALTVDVSGRDRS